MRHKLWVIISTICKARAFKPDSRNIIPYGFIQISFQEGKINKNSWFKLSPYRMSCLFFNGKSKQSVTKRSKSDFVTDFFINWPLNLDWWRHHYVIHHFSCHISKSINGIGRQIDHHPGVIIHNHSFFIKNVVFTFPILL